MTCAAAAQSKSGSDRTERSEAAQRPLDSDRWAPRHHLARRVSAGACRSADTRSAGARAGRAAGPRAARSGCCTAPPGSRRSATGAARPAGSRRALPRDTEPAIPASPSSANTHSTQLALSASVHRASPCVLGVRRKAASVANRPWIEALVTVSVVDCQIRKAPRASRQEAPVPRRKSATARSRPRTTSSGIAASRKPVSLRNTSPPLSMMLAAPTSRQKKKRSPSRSPYHWIPPHRYAQRCPSVIWFSFAVHTRDRRVAASASAGAGSGCPRSTSGSAGPSAPRR